MALVVGVFLAVAGWLVNEFFARRAVRRNMRIEYLLSAYRRLENASNRPMTLVHEAALEEAISDIQLLGSPRQVEMATTFARRFAKDQRADTEPLLEDLRTSLRRELQLEPVPPQRMWLRIARGLDVKDGPTTNERSWAVWEERTVAVAASLRAAGAHDEKVVDAPSPSSLDLGNTSPFVRKMIEVAQVSPIDAVIACEKRVGDELRRRLEDGGAGDVSGLNVSELAVLAHERFMINDATRDGVEGLRVLHTMATLDEGGHRLTKTQATDYIGLTEGILFAIRQKTGRSSD